MNRSHEFGLSNMHQPMDRHSTPKKSMLNKRLHSIMRDKRNSFLSEQTPEELEQERREGLQDLLREHSLPSEGQVKAIWQQQIGKAKMVKGRLATEDDLLKNQDHIERLAGLVQERYAISRADADKQVAAFLRRRHS